MDKEYTHPKEYETGKKATTEHIQNRYKAIVEKYCLKCDKFMGKEHDFSECEMHDVWCYDEEQKKTVLVKKKTCPFKKMQISSSELKLNYKSEE